ncbi:hypothetical protein GHT06_017703 [Daphnia sinensis]|uniref:Uncharacterized protein n=1 Tax=Daphnia sinensis TaxID=1820382 RepID=A0AAD5L3R9_9CRUS|nr:hypothetical protein GHT06_017703 [Daphnia sinensis]
MTMMVHLNENFSAALVRPSQRRFETSDKRGWRHMSCQLLHSYAYMLNSKKSYMYLYIYIYLSPGR